MASSTFEPTAGTQMSSAKRGSRTKATAATSERLDETLWARRELNALGATVLVAVTVIAVSWYGSSGTRNPSEQVGWVAVSVVGLSFATMAGVVWVLRGRCTIGIELRTLPAMLGWTAAAPAGIRMLAGSGDQPLVAAPGTIHYHRPDCVFAASRSVQERARAAHEQAGLSPCEVCEP